MLSKSRLRPTPLDAFKKAPDFPRLVAVCIEAIRDMHLVNTLTAASPVHTHNGVVDGTNVNATIVAGTVLAVLQAGPDYGVNLATAMLNFFQGQALNGEGKKRDASHLGAPETGSSKQSKTL
ncbi:hypothetical protein PENSPDRAFT_670667 [Peniophora sp. CONT]|nr:hypothetical protein PENSPDRAFT_670667 [Peniophora sp. CONT]